MPGNVISINGSEELSWYIGDSGIESFIGFMDRFFSREHTEEELKDVKESYNSYKPKFIEMENGERVYLTDVETKKRFWPVFREMMDRQFMFGGSKYKMEGQKDKEVTDWACEACPGTTGADWILGTIAKYIGRYKNFKRERDLLKIATYSYIMWLKMGHHLQEEHDEDVSVEKKDVEEG